MIHATLSMVIKYKYLVKLYNDFSCSELKKKKKNQTSVTFYFGIFLGNKIKNLGMSIRAYEGQ